MATDKIKSGRGVVAREAAPAYGASTPETPVYHVAMGERGRLVLPAEVRERLRIKSGDRLAVVLEEDSTISITTHEVALNQLRGLFKHLAPRDHFASDDLIAERRRQARMEDREFRERSALHRRMKRQGARGRG